MNEIIPKNQNNKPVRDIGVVTKEILQLKCEAQSMATRYIIEIGKRLVEAKEALDHGQWCDWLKNKVDFSQSTANNFMKIYEELGSEQFSLFSGNSQTFENLPYSKALQLIALPQQERDEFVSENNPEEMSVRELQKAIKERNEAREAAAEAQKRADELEEQAEHYEDAQRAAEEAAAEADRLRTQAQDLQNSLSEKDESIEKLKAELKKAKDDPKIPKSKIDELEAKIKKEVSEQATKKAAADLEKAQKAAAEAEAKLKEAEEKRLVAENRLKEAENRLRISNPDVAAVKTLFEGLQRDIIQIKDKILKIDAADPETGGKLKQALAALAGSIKM